MTTHHELVDLPLVSSVMYVLYPHRILNEAKNLSFNATAAFKAYSNIKDYIDEADGISKDAKARANDAIQLVRKSIICLKEAKLLSFLSSSR